MSITCIAVAGVVWLTGGGVNWVSEPVEGRVAISMPHPPAKIIADPATSRNGAPKLTVEMPDGTRGIFVISPEELASGPVEVMRPCLEMIAAQGPQPEEPK